MREWSPLVRREQFHVKTNYSQCEVSCLNLLLSQSCPTNSSSGVDSQPIARPLLSHRATLVHVVVHVVQVGQELDNNDNMGDWERFSLHKTITEL